MILLKKDNRGFSLAEIIIVVGIFSASTLAIFQLVWKNIYVQKHNKDFFTASMLAQEGLELVRNMRDKNWLDESLPADGAWNKLINNQHDDFTIDYAFVRHPEVDDVMSEGARLFINSDGYYDHDSTGTSTKFHRLITITPHLPEKLEVTATVKWEDYVTNYLGVKIPVIRDYTASTELYDWR